MRLGQNSEPLVRSAWQGEEPPIQRRPVSNLSARTFRIILNRRFRARVSRSYVAPSSGNAIPRRRAPAST